MTKRKILIQIENPAKIVGFTSFPDSTALQKKTQSEFLSFVENEAVQRNSWKILTAKKEERGLIDHHPIFNLKQICASYLI